MQETSAQTMSTPPDPSSQGSVKRVLVVEDHDSVRSLLKTVLAREAMVVDEARNGREAIECLERSRYDVVMLDLMMPIVSGYRVLEYLKANPGPTPIIVSAAGEIGLSTIDPGLTVIRKPFDTTSLRQLVRTAAGLV
jgi:CheY-like chemotaxis protein